MRFNSREIIGAWMGSREDVIACVLTIENVSKGDPGRERALPALTRLSRQCETAQRPLAGVGGAGKTATMRLDDGA